jgi:hypothetical protein
VIAVVLSLLGVAAQPISEDYALTAAALPAILSRPANPQFAAATLAAIPEILMSAPAEAMTAFLRELGDVRDLPASHGLTDADLAALRTTFLAVV